MRVFANADGRTPVIEDVVREAGVSRGTFYLHFLSLDEVCADLPVFREDVLPVTMLPEHQAAYDFVEAKLRDKIKELMFKGGQGKLMSTMLQALLAYPDYPFGWETLERISLESCARCASTGAFLGCVAWGASWPEQGARTIQPIVSRDAPSSTFLAALRRFETFYGEGRSAADSR